MRLPAAREQTHSYHRGRGHWAEHGLFLRETGVSRVGFGSQSGAARWLLVRECGDDCAVAFRSARSTGNGRARHQVDVESGVAFLHQAATRLGAHRVGVAIYAVGDEGACERVCAADSRPFFCEPCAV